MLYLLYTYIIQNLKTLDFSKTKKKAALVGWIFAWVTKVWYILVRDFIYFNKIGDGTGYKYFIITKKLTKGNVDDLKLKKWVIAIYNFSIYASCNYFEYFLFSFWLMKYKYIYFTLKFLIYTPLYVNNYFSQSKF